MFRSANFLLILGFALGLWMGFNPQAHQAVVHLWDSGKMFFADIGTKLADIGHNLMSGLKPSSQHPLKVSAKSGKKDVWTKLSNDFGDLWKSVQKIWRDVATSFHSSKS